MITDINQAINMFLNIIENTRNAPPRGISNHHQQFEKIIGKWNKTRIVLVGAKQKTGKTTYVDEQFLYQPFLKQKENKIAITIDYYSYEISWLLKYAEATVYFYHYASRKGEVQSFLEPITTDKILSLNNQRLTDEQLEAVSYIVLNYTEELFGIRDRTGKVLKPGVCRFVEKRMNAVDLIEDIKRNLLSNRIIESSYDEDGLPSVHETNPSNHHIVLIDHIGLVPTIKGSNKKESLDELSYQCVEMRNIVNTIIVPISQFNRGITKIERLKYSGEMLQPTTEDFKDTGGFTEAADLILGLFNPNEIPTIKKHLDYDLPYFKGLYRSLHVIGNRWGESAKNFGLMLDPFSKSFLELPNINEPDKFHKMVNDYIFLKSKLGI